LPELELRIDVPPFRSDAEVVIPAFFSALGLSRFHRPESTPIPTWAGFLDRLREAFSLAKGGDKTFTIVFADMVNPPRHAKALKEVSGEIEIHLPGRDPNAPKPAEAAPAAK